ncbi:MAG: FAD-dependent oxidoreductase, partial [Candidatus Wallbacteria bacterium]|nr:FAD-dependent oxidoreductase [Candidatus Wallbacteria bacterium]
LFAIPWEGRLLVGTTDTDFEGDSDHVGAQEDEVRYLLETLQSYFPDLSLTPSDVVATFAGLRPLLGADGGASASAVSREHRIVEEPSGLLTLIGGKLTTYRKMSEQVVDAVAAKLRTRHGIAAREACRTARVPIRSFATDGRATGVGRAGELGAETLRRLAVRYPGEEEVLAELVLGDPGLGEPLSPNSPYLGAEIVFACRHEMAATLPDLMIRRTHLFYREPDQGLALAPRVAELAGRALGWSEADRGRQLGLFEQAVGSSRGFRGGR